MAEGMSIRSILQAAKAIETDGMDGTRVAMEYVDPFMAVAMLLMHVRGNLSREGVSFPPDPGSADTEAKAVLEQRFPGMHVALSRPTALFYTDQWYCFDNFSAFTVEWNGRLWPTVEHAYQAAKFTDSDIIDLIWNAPSPYEAKQIAHDPQYARAMRPDFDSVKRDLMKEILRAKIRQHEYVRRKLIESVGLDLVENSPKDSFWGRGPFWTGANHLGEIWMELREEFIATGSV